MVNEEMTMTPYSIDLRKRAIECIESGKSQAYASRRFKVSTSAVSKWRIKNKMTQFNTLYDALVSFFTLPKSS